MSDKLFESILELNTQMLLQNFDAHYELHLSEDDFKRLAAYMQSKFNKQYVEEPKQTSADWNSFKIAGPGGYTTIRKLK